ncbi:nucleotidyltransferase family protein [Nocardioides sp. InS609-2]|uniref:nucleotidyltransferase family protein n=1 Tax=Nocardioides sp. InS609-2 TaxID=2760705 RepID=UPI0020C0AE04|nr:nucleotidyltransferase family protein [Nocardioides sp. InS609-2]
MTAGLLLAAGSGRRMGAPKALVHDTDGTSWLQRAVRVLTDGGCASVYVVLGAAADQARLLLDGLDVQVVVADDWDDGMSASLRAGLTAIKGTAITGEEAALVTLVDLPDVSAAVVARVLDAGSGPAVLARASYDGRPGHPVLIGRDHWSRIIGIASGDAGARDYLATRDVTLVACGDLATGQDVDRPTSGQRPRT